MNMSEQKEIILSLIDITKRYERDVFVVSAKKILRAENVKDFRDVRTRLENISDEDSFSFILRVGYPFARAGGEQAGYAGIAHEAFESIRESFHKPDFPDLLWKQFKRKCQAAEVGINERINRNLLKNLASFAQKKGNLFKWIKMEVENSGRVEQVFLQLINNGGMGKKTAAFFLRDTIWLFDLEEKIVKLDKLYIQPIDTWVRGISKLLWEDFDHLRRNDYIDFIIAKRIAEICEKLGVSGIKFNQGAWYFGSRLVKDRKELKRKLENLLENRKYQKD